MDRWQRFTLTVLVILLIATLILVRLMMDLNELRRQTNTQRVIEQVARQVRMFRSARGFLPRGLDEIVLDVPEGFSDLQGDVVDAWGHPLLYYLHGDGRQVEFVIASPGRDGAFDQPPAGYARQRRFSSNRGYPDRDTFLVGGRVMQGAVEESGR